MKPRDSALRLKRFDVAEKARKVSDLEMMLRDFGGMIGDLERQVTAEEERTGVRDPKHFAYSTFAKSVTQRRDNLVTSIEDLKSKLDDARRIHDEAKDELQRMEGADGPGSSALGRKSNERSASAG